MLALFLHLAEAGEDSIHLVRAVGIFKRAMQRFELMMQVARTAAAGDRFIQNRAALHLLHVLTKIAEREFPWDRDVALVGRFFARDHAKTRGLARTIGSD